MLREQRRVKALMVRIPTGVYCTCKLQQYDENSVSHKQIFKLWNESMKAILEHVAVPKWVKLWGREQRGVLGLLYRKREQKQKEESQKKE